MAKVKMLDFFFSPSYGCRQVCITNIKKHLNSHCTLIQLALYSSNEILSKEWQKKGSCDHFQPEMDYLGSAGRQYTKKNLKVKYATFEGGFFMFSWAKNHLKKKILYMVASALKSCFSNFSCMFLNPNSFFRFEF